MNEDIRKITIQNNQIIAVYVKPCDDPLYKTVCYIAKNSDIAKKSVQELTWPDDIENKIEKENIRFE